MKSFDCVIHGKVHTNEDGWRYKSWDSPRGIIWGWGCLSAGQFAYPEFTTEKIREERKKYLKSMIQSHRGGQLSSEFVKYYPDKINGMIKAGAITREEVKRAKPVWRDLPNYKHIDKTQ